MNMFIRCRRFGRNRIIVRTILAIFGFTFCWIYSTIRNKAVQNVPQFSTPIDYPYAIQPAEIAFPLAFSLQVYHEFDRVLRLLHAIYRPHNCYCVHIDAKVNSIVRRTVEAEIEKRYGANVLVVPERESFRVSWGRMSSLDADLLCSQLLLDQCFSNWEYWINLTGEEFPIQTNWEMVTALKLFNKSNVITQELSGPWSLTNKYRWPTESGLKFELQWHKQAVHVALRREFVHFVHHSERAKQILQALRRFEHESFMAKCPDETYFATLNYNPDVVGSPIRSSVDGVILRYKQWYGPNVTCHSGVWRRNICMLGAGDVHELIPSPRFFANKFIPAVEPIGYDMLEKWLAGKVRYESTKGKLRPTFNETVYRLINRWTPS